MRLTTRTEDGRAIIKLYTDPTDIKGVIDESAQKNREVVEKLARYEDLEEVDPETGLRDCPFCGGHAYVEKHIYYGRSIKPNYGVYCKSCNATTYEFWDNKDVAIAAWNRRAGEQE